MACLDAARLVLPSADQAPLALLPQEQVEVLPGEAASLLRFVPRPASARTACWRIGGGAVCRLAIARGGLRQLVAVTPLHLLARHTINAAVAMLYGVMLVRSGDLPAPWRMLLAVLFGREVIGMLAHRPA